MKIEADLIVAGGGAAGVAASVAAARQNIRTILIEKNGYLGGTATASLVTPMMLNQSRGKSLTEGIYQEVLEGLHSKYGGAERFSDNNMGWFNPELMKIHLDEVCQQAGVEIFFNMEVIEAAREGSMLSGITGFFHGQRVEFKAGFYIDASGNADLAYLAGVPMLTDSGRQALSLRFLTGGVDLAKLVAWLKKADPDMKDSDTYFHPSGSWMLTTAHTLDDPGWVLRPYFEEGIREGLITKAEAAYFQIFTIPGMPDVVAFNCPRIDTSEPLDPLNAKDMRNAYLTGRQQIIRLVNFCKAKLPGFDRSYLLQVAPQMGVRESRRIKGKYILTEDDILACRKFKGEAVAKSSYPIDIHQASPDADTGGLKKLKEGDYYEIPRGCLEPEGVGNLLVAGRCVSATFVAQSSLRIQPVCWAMGESAGNIAAAYLSSNKGYPLSRQSAAPGASFTTS